MARVVINGHSIWRRGADSDVARSARWNGGDVDFVKWQLTVQRSRRRGHVTAPTGERVQHLPLTCRLVDALRAIRLLETPVFPAGHREIVETGNAKRLSH